MGKSLNIDAEKLSLIQWITELTDENIISRLKSYKKESSDWWLDLSIEQQQKLKQAIKEAENGEFIDYDNYISKHRVK